MKVSSESLDLIGERKKALKEIMPEVFVEGKLDANKLKQALGDEIESSGERYSFSWAGKSTGIKLRDKPSKATLIPSRAESIDFDETDNVFIEGENLEALKILQKAYQGKAKMIYIDPPYNTGKDFVYKDDFSDSLKNYLRYTGQVNGNGEKTSTNTETSGRYHSNWLTMMYPRLSLARNLLSEDGVIFVSIDDNEVQNLRLIMNEIFGEENFISQMVWKKKSNPPNNVEIGTVHEYVLVYAKDVLHSALYLLERSEELDASYGNPDNDPRGPWKSGDLSAAAKGGRITPSLIYEITNPHNGEKHSPPKGRMWIVAKEQMENNIRENRIWWGQDHAGKPKYKRFLSEVRQGVSTSSLLDDVGTNSSAARELSELFNGALVFETPKPVQMVKRFVQITTPNDGGIVLDFFAGSGVTAEAVISQNIVDEGHRKFILVQLPEPNPGDSEARKAGYKTIADICKERIRRVIKKLKDEGKQQKIGNNGKPDFGFKVFKLSKSNCFVWDDEEASDPNTLAKHIEESAKGASKAEAEALLYEVMLREGFALDSEVAKVKHGKNDFYQVGDEVHKLFACFDDKLDEEAVKKLALEKDDKLVVLDSALSDTQKVNLSRKMRVETV